ncbi:hypothetical protein K6W16_16495 [Burkholderia dolosa]|jgi:hypothetical protein|uniref:Uncharacterized protein n=1 Tax=Burkholderia dolosa TaxID=152500 RepID=A0A892I418_9BURK|nr:MULTISPECIES: hypothetical protein [Burkholderia]AKE03890.1 hypothetical protein XM57_13620 [Burkholderia cepacia]AJY12519.1 hypothetical protein AK34_1681 [Burkholderia dolosa AU0158]AYZ98658.1 hypothetical protein EGY28_27755 [Burkholderia dolosa]ETP65667.1 hypothetical protein BDSB_09985 [Burkholderia dolosa PC543]MBR8059301.1 hypothetical protein [Burkholderia dolosa]
MKKTSLAILVAMSALTGAAYAQESTEIKTITDPAKIAEIEQRAQALQQQQAAEAAQPAAHEEHHGKKAHHKAAKKAGKKAAKAAPAEAASQ